MNKILCIFLFFNSVIIFGQSYSFETSTRSNYGIFVLENESKQIDEFFIYKPTNYGYNFEVLSKDLSKITSGNYEAEFSYPFIANIKSIKNLGNKLGITKTYYHQQNHAYPFEVTYIFDKSSGDFDRLFYQNENVIAVSENKMSFTSINKARKPSTITEFTPFFDHKIKVLAETNRLSKVMLFAKIKESNLKIVDESGNVEWSSENNVNDKENLQYNSLIKIISNRNFVIENNFDEKNKFKDSYLRIYDNQTDELVSGFKLNENLKPFYDIKTIEKKGDNFIILGLYKAATKYFSDLDKNSYAGFFRWVLDKDGNVITQNTYGWTRISNQLNYFIGTKEGETNYLFPYEYIETKNGFTILLKNISTETYTPNKNHTFILNFDKNDYIVSSKNYMIGKNTYYDFFYDEINDVLKILEKESINNKTTNLIITNANNNFSFVYKKQLDQNTHPFKFIDNNQVLLINEVKKTVNLNIQTIN